MKPPDSDWDKYNSDLRLFYERYEKYLLAKREHEKLMGRTAVLEIDITNVGSSPATDISVYMHFPDGFELLSIEDFDSPPTEPNPPEQPVCCPGSFVTNLG